MTKNNIPVLIKQINSELLYKYRINETCQLILEILSQKGSLPIDEIGAHYQQLTETSKNQKSKTILGS